MMITAITTQGNELLKLRLKASLYESFGTFCGNRAILIENEIVGG
jgi:hypothetical protein